MIRWLKSVVPVALVGVMVVSYAGSQRPVAQGAAGLSGPRFGGTVKHAELTEPANLDPHLSSAQSALLPARHMFEHLFTQDKDFRYVPDLVSSYTVVDMGRQFTFRLREGVKFHDGKELTAEDVVASLARWGRLNPWGKAVFADLLRLEATGKYTVQLRFRIKVGALIPYLGTFMVGAVIYPKAIAEKYRDTAIREYIGTGPYRFVQWVSDSHVKLRRFDGYSARREPPSGYGGKRTAYIDELIFAFVPDAVTRAISVQAGDFDFAREVHPADYPALRKDAKLNVVRGGTAHMALYINHTRGPLTHKKVRQALQATFDMGQIMRVTFGHEDLYRLDSSVVPKETFWWTNAGANLYNQADPEKARRLLREAGYAGEKIRWLVATDRPYLHDAAVVGADQLKRVGFNIELVLMDWTALADTRRNPERFEVYLAPADFRSQPYTVAWLSSTWFGWWVNEEKEALREQLLAEANPDRARKIWGQIQLLAHEDVAVIKFGDYFPIHLASKRLKDFGSMPDIFWWNAYLGN